MLGVLSPQSFDVATSVPRHWMTPSAPPWALADRPGEESLYHFDGQSWADLPYPAGIIWGSGPQGPVVAGTWDGVIERIN